MKQTNQKEIAQSTNSETLNTTVHKKWKQLGFDTFMQEVDLNFPLLSIVFQDMKIVENGLLSGRGVFDSVSEGAEILDTRYHENSRFVIRQPAFMRETSFFAGYRLKRENFPVYYGERETNRYGEMQTGARISLWRDINIDTGRVELKQTQTDLRLADLFVFQQKVEIFRNAAIRYWDWVSAVEKYKIAKCLYDIALERQKQMEKRVKAGDSAKIEQVDNERVLLQRESMFLEAEQLVKIMSNKLIIYLKGKEEIRTILSSELLPQNPFAQLEDILNINLNKEIEIAIERITELLRFQTQKEQNRIDQELTKNSKTEMGASATSNVPLSTRKQQGKPNANIAKNKKLDAQEELLRSRINADIKSQYKILEMTRQRAKLTKKELDIAHKLEQTEINRFKIGEGTLIVVSIREHTTAEAAFREIDAKSDHNKAIINFKSAMMDNLLK